MDADPYQQMGSASGQFQRLRDFVQARPTFLRQQLGVCPDDICNPGEDGCTCPADCGEPPATASNCSDGVDNDCDTLTDCLDAECTANPACLDAPIPTLSEWGVIVLAILLVMAATLVVRLRRLSRA